MLCPHCRAQLPDDAAFCDLCGNAITPPSPKTGSPLPKRQYLWKAAPPQTQQHTKIALIIGIVCLLLVFLSAYTVICGSFADIPILKMVAGEDEMEYIEKRADYVLGNIDKAIEESDDDAIERLEDEYGISIKKLRNAFDPFSLRSCAKYGPAITGDSDEYEVIQGVIIFVIVYAALIALITALALLFFKNGLLVLAYILSLPFHVFLSGTVFLLLCSVAYIAFSILLTKLNKEYKTYKLSF